jgi:squalene-hopene/tetraprenyl-beta-curcumene cyclase
MSLDASILNAIDPDRLQAAYDKARAELLNQRDDAGHWIGELATSALSTATAVSALACTARAVQGGAVLPGGTAGLPSSEPARMDKPSMAPHSDVYQLIERGIQWLAAHQRPDGGWGDTQQSHSNVATTMLAVAAFHLASATERFAEKIKQAEHYLDEEGRLDALRRRYGRDKTFAVPILTNCALAGLVPWKNVSALPFELACLPQSMYRFLRLPVVSYAIPALVAIGQARYFHRPPLTSLMRWIRRRSVEPSLAVLEAMQPASGGYLEAVPLTSFVVMSLASTGRAQHAVTQRGLEFIKQSVRPDGSWPIDTNLATWNTTLALNALSSGGEDLSAQKCLDWLLACQNKEMHPYTGAAPGGWGWSDLSGSVPDADDTPGALIALSAWSRSARCHGRDRRRIRDAAAPGIRWLLELQNRDGGWPTFCRGWGKLPFDRSGADLTAHALRALHAWSDLADSKAAIERGLKYLARVQHSDGSWTPLWFGNQDHPREENPVYGTSRVLLAYRDLQQLGSRAAQRGMEWLVYSRNPDGGWGGGPSLDPTGKGAVTSSVEETAVAVEALMAQPENLEASSALAGGLQWLVDAVLSDRYQTVSPIGLYFAKLWYHERLYPIIFVVSALGHARRRLPASLDPRATYSRLSAKSDGAQPEQPIVQA